MMPSPCVNEAPRPEQKMKHKTSEWPLRTKTCSLLFLGLEHIRITVQCHCFKKILEEVVGQG